MLLKNLCLNSTELTNVFESRQISECFFFSFLWKLVARNEILGCHIYIIVGCIMFLLSLFFIFIYFAAPDLSSGTWDFLVVASEIFLNSFACKFLVVAHEIYFPDQGLNLGPLHWEGGVLATGLPDHWAWGFDKINFHILRYGEAILAYTWINLKSSLLVDSQTYIVYLF